MPQLTAENEGRWKAEEALRASEERRKLGAAVAGLALAEIDYASDTTFLSSEAARLFGLGDAPITLPRAAIHATFHPDDRAELRRRIEASLDPAGPGWFEMDHRVVWPDRKTRWLRVRKQVFFEGEGASRRPSHAMLAAFDVTKEKTASDALRASEEFVRNVLDSLPQEVVVLDSAGTVIAVNEPWKRFARENDGATQWLSIGADYLEACRTSAKSGEPHACIAFGGLEDLLEGSRGELMMEYPCDDPDGSRRWFVMHAARLGSGPAGVVLSHTDITPQKKAEEALRATAAALQKTEALARADEERLRLFIDHAPVAVAMLDRDMRYVSCSGCWLKAYGLKASILGQSHYEVFPEITEGWKEIHRRALAGETLTADEDRFDRADGTIQWLRWEVRPWFEAGGLIGGIVVFSEDITEQKQAREALRESEQRFRSLAELSPDAILVNAEGCFVYSNQAAVRLLAAKSAEDILGRTPYDVVERAAHDLVRERIRLALEEGQAVPFIEYRWRGLTGNYVNVEVATAPILWKGKQAVQVVARDVTERKRHEEQIRDLMNEVNHRAKNLLTVVQSIARLTTKGKDSAAFADLLEERIGALAASQDLLVKSNWTGVELSDLVRSQLSHYAHLLGARIRLDGPPLRLDSSAAQTLGMAIHELGTNAVKYGALSNDFGLVRLVWFVFDSGHGPQVRLNWTETGGPPLSPPAQRGFGHKVTVNMAKRALDADVVLDYAREGLIWELTAPLEKITGERGAGVRPAAAKPLDVAGALKRRL